MSMLLYLATFCLFAGITILVLVLGLMVKRENI